MAIRLRRRGRPGAPWSGVGCMLSGISKKSKKIPKYTQLHHHERSTYNPQRVFILRGCGFCVLLPVSLGSIRQYTPSIFHGQPPCTSSVPFFQSGLREEVDILSKSVCSPPSTLHGSSPLLEMAGLDALSFEILRMYASEAFTRSTEQKFSAVSAPGGLVTARHF